MKRNFTLRNVPFEKESCPQWLLKFLKSTSLALILLNLLTFSALAQTRQVTGTVVDDNGEPLIGVGVQVKNSSIATQTNVEGKFSIRVAEPNAVLVFTYVGYNRKEVTATSNTINVTLLTDVKALDDVVVIGYGTQSKPTITGAISSISGKEILRAPVSNIANALAGRATGITATQRSGEPGRDVANIFIRGLATINSANARPLILVDGVERELATIDPYTIESLNILKDASATAVFGVRGANGVIIITTKTGSVGKPQFSFSSNLAMQNPIRLPEMLNSYDFATLRNEAGLNDAQPPVFSAYDLERYQKGDDPYFHPDVDWMEYMLKDYSPQQQYNLNVSGGFQDAKYFVSLGYLNQDGAYELGDIFNEFSANPNFKRYNIRTNFDFNVTKKLTLSIKAGTDLTNSNYSRSSTSDIFGTILSASPVMSPVLYDGKVIRNVRGVAGAFQISNTPLFQMLTQGFNTNFSSNLNTNIGLKYNLDAVTKGLSVRAMGAYDNFYAQTASRSKQIPLWDLDYNPNAQNFQDSIAPVATINQFEGPVSFIGESFTKFRRIYGELAIDYNRSFDGGHSVSALALGTIERSYNGRNNSLPNTFIQLPYNYLGVVGRITYNYKTKYLAEFNMGYNGSENFARGRQFGFFPAGSLGYILSEESFIPKNNYLTYVKLRGSLGKVGNDKAGEPWDNRFLFIPSAFVPGPTYFFGQNRNGVSGFREGTIGNPDVTWETAVKLNLGADLKFFKDKLSITGEYFTESRSGILLRLNNIPVTFGPTGLVAPLNVGQVENKGFEFELGYDDKIGKDFTYSIKGNYSFARNKILYQDEIPQQFPNLVFTGGRLGQMKGLQANGIYNTVEEIQNDGLVSTYVDQAFGLRPGDIRYVDQPTVDTDGDGIFDSGDGIIDFNDFVNIGNPNIPEVTYGLNIGLKYKNFELNTLFQGASNVSTYLVGEAAWPFMAGTKTAFESAKERWTPERYANGEKITQPRLSSNPGGNQHNYITSSFWMQDASYLRLKNVEIAYTFNPQLIKKIGLKYARVFVNGQNLLTFSKMKYFDPEIANSNGAVYPMVRVFNLGTNIQF
jgi:TonB-linked SusC/RagA family outer membrane protein